MQQKIKDPVTKPAKPAKPVGEAPAKPQRERRTQAERSDATRELILDAAVTLIRKRGYGGLRTGEVSEMANVSRGAQLHHFPTKNDLLVATLRHMNQKMMAAHRERLAQARKAGSDPIEFIIADATDFFFGDYFFIILSIGMSDERNMELHEMSRPISKESRYEIERNWRAILEEAGLPRQISADILDLTMSIARGFSIRRLLDDNPARFKKLFKIWREMVKTYLETQAGIPAPRKSAGK